MDADGRQRVVHRPLHFGRGVGHFRLDAIQQRRQIQTVRILRDPLGGEVPACPGLPAVVRGHPILAKRRLVGVLRDDVGVKPVRHAHKGGGPHHPIHRFRRQLFRLDQERGQELGVHVPGVPESNGQLVVGLDLRGKLPDVTKPDAELVVSSAILSVLRTDLPVVERFQLRESILVVPKRICTSVRNNILCRRIDARPLAFVCRPI